MLACRETVEAAVVDKAERAGRISDEFFSFPPPSLSRHLNKRTFIQCKKAVNAIYSKKLSIYTSYYSEA